MSFAPKNTGRQRQVQPADHNAPESLPDCHQVNTVFICKLRTPPGRLRNSKCLPVLFTQTSGSCIKGPILRIDDLCRLVRAGQLPQLLDRGQKTKQLFRRGLAHSRPERIQDWLPRPRRRRSAHMSCMLTAAKDVRATRSRLRNIPDPSHDSPEYSFPSS